jgi:hypothetical protein
MAFISKRPVKAGDLSGVSGKLSESQKGPEPQPVLMDQPAVPEPPPSPAGLNQVKFSQFQ